MGACVPGVPGPAPPHLVMTTPQGTGAPTNLWPDTDTEPMGFLNDTIGASRRRKGIIMPNSAPSQWMKKRSSVKPASCGAGRRAGARTAQRAGGRGPQHGLSVCLAPRDR